MNKSLIIEQIAEEELLQLSLRDFRNKPSAIRVVKKIIDSYKEKISLALVREGMHVSIDKLKKLKKNNLI